MKVIKYFVAVLIVSTLVSCNGQSTTNKSLKTELDSVSYALGLDMAIKIKSNFKEADKDFFIQGFRNGIDSLNIQIDEENIGQVISNYFRSKKQRDAEENAEAAFGQVKKDGEAFLEANKSKEGVHVTDSGLQYVILKEGDGPKPTRDSRVKVHYHGTLIDGTVFDSSIDRGEPSEFGVTQVIQGWIEGLPLMNVGSKYRFFIPQELGYGSNPRPGGVIKPFAALIFDIELIEII